MSATPDIYFEKKYAAIYQDCINTKAEVFVFDSEYGQILHSFLLRTIPKEQFGIQVTDIITPHGYGGPIILRVEQGCKEKLLQSYSEAWYAYCRMHGIVSEYIRFHPLLKNHLDFTFYDYEPARKTVSVDLTDAFFENEFTPRCRNSIRKAQKSGVYAKIDFTGTHLDIFYDIYCETMDKNRAGNYHYFEPKYFKQLITDLNKKCFLVHAFLEETIIASSFFLVGEKFLHYHLSGARPKYLGIPATNLILYEAALWGKQNGKVSLFLGGGRSLESEHEGLLAFKKSFSRSELLDYYAGKRICDDRQYAALVNIASGMPNFDSSFFPAYRSVI